jgi:diguanylate cyclase (GGDEF)-like protein
MRRERRERDGDLRRRQVEILRGLSSSESPRILFAVALVIVAFDVGYAMVGIVPSASYYVSDVVQGLYMVVVGILILRRMIPVRWAPALFASAIVVNNLVLNFQYTLVGYSAVGVILLLLASYGAVTLMWRPFLISAAIMAVATSYTVVVTDPEQGPGWAITALAALAISAAILHGRSRTAIALASANRTIEQMATRDALTGLLNRHGLRESGVILTSLADRGGVPLFAMFVDIVGLKGVNNGQGHLVGDTVIQRTAQALASQCREGDLLCRWGGDEFVVVGVDDAPDAKEFAARVSSAVDPAGIEGQWTPAVHTGAASGRDESIESLIDRADHAMYLNRIDL